jgi:DivIVA domain-containing protein
VNGDGVRAVRFYRGEIEAYKARGVDDLLRHVAAELDAGRLAEPLIKNAVFRRSGRARGYDVDAVDWFLDQFLLPRDHPEPAGMSADPWHDLAVARLTRSEVGGPATRPAGRAWLAYREHFAEECANAWRDFGRAPGTHLWWGPVKRGRYELRTAEEQTIASLRRPARPATVSTGGKSFTFEKIRPGRSSSPGFAEIVARSQRDYDGHFAKNRHSSMILNDPFIGPKHRVRRVTDETGNPVLYVSGRNFASRAWASITFPDLRWLRFLVRGTRKENAIMTAVDQAGNSAVRYRITHSRSWARDTVEITVHPEWELTDELALAIAVSAPWIPGYFSKAGGG